MISVSLFFPLSSTHHQPKPRTTTHQYTPATWKKSWFFFLHCQFSHTHKERKSRDKILPPSISNPYPHLPLAISHNKEKKTKKKKKGRRTQIATQKNRIATHFGGAFWHQTLHFSTDKLTFIAFLLFTALFIVTLSNDIITERSARVTLSIGDLHGLNGGDGPKSTTSGFLTLHRRRTESVIEKREKERKVWETEKDREWDEREKFTGIKY